LEETTLSVSEDIHLLRRGKPFSFIDHELRTKWTVYPFAWELQPGAKPIKLDWEHTEVKFVKPVDLDKYDHVPLLEVGMHRVLVGDETEMGLQELGRDHESGAQALAVKALEILLNSVQKGDLKNNRRFLEGIDGDGLASGEEWEAKHGGCYRDSVIQSSGDYEEQNRSLYEAYKWNTSNK
jgi:hypothetical protein